MNTEKTIADLTVNEFKALMADILNSANENIQQDNFLRLEQVLEMFPVSKSQWWHGVKIGIYPDSIKLSPKITVWRQSDIQKIIKKAK